MWNSPKTANNRQLQEVPFIRVNPNHLPSSMRFLGANDVLQKGINVCEGLQSRNFDRQEHLRNMISSFLRSTMVLIRLCGRRYGTTAMGETILLETGGKDKTAKGFKIYLERYEALKLTRLSNRPVVDAVVSYYIK
jgi:hypothetical protein